MEQGFKDKRKMGSPEADDFLRGQHPEKLSAEEAQKLGMDSEPLYKPEPEPVRLIQSSPDVLEGQMATKEVKDPIKLSEFQRPDYFHLHEGQEIYISGTDSKTKAYLKTYNSATRMCSIWLADKFGNIDYRNTKTVHQNLVYIKV